MTSEHTIYELKRYHDELVKIMNRFTRSSSSLHIHSEDDPRFRKLVIEITDLLNDSLGKNHYSPNIINIFNEGISNFTSSPSYGSVERVVVVIDSVITRLKRNPGLCNQKKTVTTPEKINLTYPDKITLKWLWEHVPAHYWWSLVLLLFIIFGLGLKFANTNLYKSITE